MKLKLFSQYMYIKKMFLLRDSQYECSLCHCGRDMEMGAGQVPAENLVHYHVQFCLFDLYFQALLDY